MIVFYSSKGRKIAVGADFFAVTGCWWLLSGAEEKTAAAMLTAILLHECGHLFMYGITDIPISEVIFDFKGITIRPKEGIYPFWKELSSIVGGAAASGISLLVLRLFSCPFSSCWIEGHLAVLIYSLMPFPGTDGGEICAMIWNRFFGRLL